MASNESESESARVAIDALNRQWEISFDNHDAAALAALFTEDCVRLPQGGSTTIGRSALEAAYQHEFAGIWLAQAKVVLKTEEVIVSGNYAFARGTDTVVWVEDGRQVEETGKWISVYRREADGTWMYHWSTYNSNQ